MLAPVIAVARPIVIEGAKQAGGMFVTGLAIGGLTACVITGMVAGAKAVQLINHGGRAAANGLTGLFRKKEQPMQAAADEGKVIFTQSEAEVTELFRKADQAA